MKFYGICGWCNKNPIKFKNYKTCSRSCGSSLRWFKMGQNGKLLIFKNASEHARRTKYCKRIRAECEKHCKELNIEVTSSILKLYVRARTRGYMNGWCTANRRIRRRA